MYTRVSGWGLGGWEEGGVRLFPRKRVKRGERYKEGRRERERERDRTEREREMKQRKMGHLLANCLNMSRRRR